MFELPRPTMQTTMSLASSSSFPDAAASKSTMSLSNLFSETVMVKKNKSNI